MLVRFSTAAVGYAFVIAQGMVVAFLAELEYYGLRRIASWAAQVLSWTPSSNATNRNRVGGYEALEARMRVTHENWVRNGGRPFRTRHARSHHNTLRLMWDMVAISDRQIISAGAQFLLLGRDGKMREDYQFIEPPT